MAKKNEKAQEQTKAEKNLNIASTVILAIIVVTFIAAPTVTGFLGQGAVSFGSYAGRSIDHTNENYFGSQVRELAQYRSDQIPPESLWRQAFQNAAFRVALQVEAEEGGVLISNPLIDNQLRQFGPYLDRDGNFSPQLFRETPDADKARYRQDIQESLLQSEWVNIRITGPKIPQRILQKALEIAYPQRQFDYVAFTQEDYPLSEAESWGRSNSKLFKTMVLSRITITTSEKDALQVLEEAKKGERTFESLAEAYSKDQFAQVGGSMGRVSYHELQGDFSQPEDLDALFNLNAPSLSPVYKTPLGWAIYRVQEGAKPANFEDAGTQQAVRQYLLTNERGIVEDYLNKKASELRELIQTSGWDAALQRFNKTAATTEFVSINFGNHPLLPALNPGSGGELSGLNNSEEFYRQVFTLSAGQVSKPLPSNRRVLLFRLKEIKDRPGEGDKNLDALVQQAGFYLPNQRVQQYQNSLLGSYKFKDTFEEGYRQRLRTFQE